MPADAVSAITESLPPATDYMTYLIILESHLSPDVLPTLNDLLQDTTLTQNIGWDLIQLLLPLPGSEECLTTIAKLGNPREVVLKVTEALQMLDLDEEYAEDRDQPSPIKRFCVLISLLSILHPRIKTKYPSRFLSTSLIAILSTFRPSNQATLAVISFIHTMSGKRRPPLPGRKSSQQIPTIQSSGGGAAAPDPEAQDEDPQEAAIQTRLQQSFMTHILEEYVNANTLEWAARLQESYDPKRVVLGRSSLGETFKMDPELVTRETIIGQLVALARDLGLVQNETLLEAIYSVDLSADKDAEDDEETYNYPSSPSDVPLSKGGCLFLITSFVFASVLFESKYITPKLTIFPDHARLVKKFIGPTGPDAIGTQVMGVIDAVIALGIWLENNNQFVAGPLEDEDFLQQLQSLSLLSANTPSPTLRYAAHVLTASILHAHPVDRLRLTFILDTLEHCPYEALKASAVSWLKDEIITAHERNAENIFSTDVAMSAAQPLLFPDMSALSEAGDEEVVQEMEQSFPFHMAVVNFLYFIGGKQYENVVPERTMTIVENLYLGPLKNAQSRCSKLMDGQDMQNELGLLRERIEMCSERSDG